MISDPIIFSQNFVWHNLDLNNPIDLDELHELLGNNYVSDITNTFYLHYNKDFLRFALQTPNYKSEWHLGLRLKTKPAQLVAFVSAIPICLSINQIPTKSVEINFLCVHQKLRHMKLTPILIKEITNRILRSQIHQAVYTIGTVKTISNIPISLTRYYHKLLNPKKLAYVGFVKLNKKLTLTQLNKLNKLSPINKKINLRLMEKKDCPQACELLDTYLKKFKLHMMFDLTEFEHWFSTRPDVIETYVVENSDAVITDLISYYILPTVITNCPKYPVLKVAYLWYVVANSTSLNELVQSLLIILLDKGFDLCNCLNIMNNQTFISDLNFIPGDGGLNYYLHHTSNKINPNEIGLILM